MVNKKWTMRKVCEQCREVYKTKNQDSRFCSKECQNEYSYKILETETEKEVSGKDFQYLSVDELFKTLYQ